MAGVEEMRAEEEGDEDDEGDDDGDEGPGLDVERAVGERFGAHGGNMKEEVGSEKEEVGAK